MNSDLLKRIGNAPGAPGHEEPVQSIIAAELKACCDEVWVDHMGSVFALKRATKKPTNGRRPVRVMLAAHADEIGFMVKYINDAGYISCIQVGGINPINSVSQRVVIHGKEPVRGVIAPKYFNPSEAMPSVEDLLIDTGLPKEEVEKLIAPGDVVTYDEDTSVLNDKVWVGRNFDNRIGSYTMVEAMRTVGETTVDVFAVSTVQEEVGLRGARPAAFSVAPDIGIAIDGSMPKLAYSAAKDFVCEMGKGAGLYVIDKLTIGHPKLVKYILEMCAERGVMVQKNIGGGTDAAAIQQSRAGVIATTVGAPVRYMHSTCQLCHADDMDNTVGLLCGVMQTADKFYEQLMQGVSPELRYPDQATMDKLAARMME